jgi:FkbM family methyltransferase
LFHISAFLPGKNYIMALSEFIYTVVFKPRFIRKFVNKIILAVLPKTIRIGHAVVCLNPQDPVVSGALTFGLYERQEIALVSHIFREGMTIVDVGANVGLYTAIAMQRINRRGRIIAFEPHAESYRFLMRTVEANAALLPLSERPKVNTLDVAASSSEGEAHLFANAENKGDNRLYSFNLMPASSALPVRARTVDSVLRDYGITTIDFLKVDVQGYEFEVIQGSREILRSSANAIILSEFWPDGIRQASNRDSIDYLLFLTDLNFHIYQLTANKLKLLRGSLDFQSLISQLKGRQYANIVCTKRVFSTNLDSAFPLALIDGSDLTPRSLPSCADCGGLSRRTANRPIESGALETPPWQSPKQSC